MHDSNKEKKELKKDLSKSDSVDDDDLASDDDDDDGNETVTKINIKEIK